MGGALADPKRPLVAILGGAKVSDKIGVISNLIDKCDTIIIGGGMAYTFMKYLGHNIGTSLLEADWVDKAGEMMQTAKDKGVKFLIPIDNRCGKEYKEDTEVLVCKSDDIPDGWMGLDIGPKTQALFAGARHTDFSGLEQPGDYDLVYNTVPHMIFTKRELQALRRDTVLVDLASFPGGVDTLMAHTLGITVVDGRNLPGRTAPETAGALIGETVAEMIEEGLE